MKVGAEAGALYRLFVEAEADVVMATDVAEPSRAPR